MKMHEADRLWPMRSNDFREPTGCRRSTWKPAHISAYALWKRNSIIQRWSSSLLNFVFHWICDDGRREKERIANCFSPLDLFCENVKVTSSRFEINIHSSQLDRSESKSRSATSIGKPYIGFFAAFVVYSGALERTSERKKHDAIAIYTMRSSFSFLLDDQRQSFSAALDSHWNLEQERRCFVLGMKHPPVVAWSSGPKKALHCVSTIR